MLREYKFNILVDSVVAIDLHFSIFEGSLSASILDVVFVGLIVGWTGLAGTGRVENGLMRSFADNILFAGFECAPKAVAAASAAA